MNKNNLKRKKLIDIINKHNNDNTILSLLKEEFEVHDYYQDERFMPELKDDYRTWRQDFLKEEAKEYIKNGDVDFAYKNLFELICAENPGLHGSNISKIHFKNESDKEKHKNYYQDGFICEKEKNIIMEVINAIENNKENNITKMINPKINYLKLGENNFELNENKSSLSIEYDDKNFISINIDISFEDGEYKDLDVSPNIEINNIKTSVNKLDDLKGILFEINDVNESYDRGDSFYLYESEPFVKYKIEILEISEQNAHIKLNGVCITDGYSKPYKTEDFTVDAIITIKIYNDSNMSKEENKIINKEQRKDKIKAIIGLGLYGLITGLVGVILLIEFIKQHSIIHLVISILMIIVSLFCLGSSLNEIFINIRNKK